MYNEVEVEVENAVDARVRTYSGLLSWWGAMGVLRRLVRFTTIFV